MGACGQFMRVLYVNKYTQPKKYSYTLLFVFFNYLDSYLIYMFGIFLKTKCGLHLQCWCVVFEQRSVE